MGKVKFILKTLIISTALFFMGCVFAKDSYAAPRLYLDPSAQTAIKDSEFQVVVGINVETTQVFGTEAKFNFPQGDIELKSISNGGFFSDFSSSFSQTSGTFQIRGYFSSLYETKTGTGNVAILKFSAKKDSGTGTITFSCNDTKILDINGTNILNCGNLNQLNLTYSSAQTPTNPPSSGSGGTTTTTTSGNISCGGYCGTDNSKCSSGLYCYYSYCRNPACGNELNCICPLTSYPTAKPKVVVNLIGKKSTPTPTPTIAPTPIPEIQIVDFTPYETPAAELLPEEEVTQEKSFPVIPAIIVGIIIGILLLIVNKLKKKNNPPQINPPVNPPTPESPMPTNYPPFTPPTPPTTPPPPTPPIA